MRTTTLPCVRLGRSQSLVSRIGYGALHWSLGRTSARGDARAMIRGVIDLGLTFIDTADAYYTPPSAPHDNERLIAESLEETDESNVMVGTKGGVVRPEGRWVADCRPDHLARTIRESFDALGGQRPLALWQLHAVDRSRDLRRALAPVAAAVSEGLIQHVGLSNATVDDIDRAREVIDIVSVQNRFSLWHRRPERDGTLEYCAREGLTFFCWGPLGGPGGLANNAGADRLASLAAERGVSAACMALAWLLAKGDQVVPIVGSRSLAHIEEILNASGLALSEMEGFRMQQTPRREMGSCRK